MKPNKNGLTTTEARGLLRTHGLNEISQTPRLSALADFLVRFKNPLIVILLFAACVSAFIRDWVSALLIVGIVVVSIFLDFLNTYKSQKAAESLKAKVRITATVKRDGTFLELPLAQLVPGDVVELTPGDVVPADGRIAQGKDFFVNESSLTGESFPVEKRENDEVYMGSSVVTGDSVMLVTLTGADTKFSRIAHALSAREQQTEFDRGIRDFSGLIMKITMLLVILIFFLNAFLKGSVLEAFLFALALAVGLTPELLPMIIALNLSHGSLAMAKHGVIVKKLSAIQNFGSMDVLCTDKTGTLTEDKITLVKYIDGQGKRSEEVLRYAYVSSFFRSAYKNPLDTAVLEFKHMGIDGFVKIDEIPFDYKRKRDSVVAEREGKRVLVSKGVPEELLKVCTRYGPESKPLTAALRRSILEEHHRLSTQGFRVLALAIRQGLPKRHVYQAQEEKAMTFLGFVAFFDPAKQGVTAVLKRLERYGVEIKIITGDNELVTQKIAAEIQLPIKGLVLGHELEVMSDQKLAHAARQSTIFARVNPDQKKRIIESLQKSGHVVGYLGDGINDAPSLRAADVGISVNNAVDVAKETADLILLKKSLGDLVEGVLQGRRTFANTLKYLMMSLSSSFGNVFSMAAASVFLPFLPMLPTQILFNNLLYDASQFAIPLDSVDTEYIQKPRKFDIKFIKKFMFVFGPASSLFDLLTFVVLFWVFGLSGSLFQSGWFIESIATQALVIFIVRTRLEPFVKSWPSKILAFNVLAAVAVGWAVLYLPVGRWFGFTPLPLPVVVSIITIVIAYLVVTEVIKRYFYRKLVMRE